MADRIKLTKRHVDWVRAHPPIEMYFIGTLNSRVSG